MHKIFSLATLVSEIPLKHLSCTKKLLIIFVIRLFVSIISTQIYHLSSLLPIVKSSVRYKLPRYVQMIWVKSRVAVKDILVL